MGSEIKSEYLFEKETNEGNFPQYQSGTFGAGFMLGLHSYASLLANRSTQSRMAVHDVLTIHLVLLRSLVPPCALRLTRHVLPAVDWHQRCPLLRSEHLPGAGSHEYVDRHSFEKHLAYFDIDNTNSLLATGVVGVTMFLTTIPSVIWVDSVGRKPILISGAFLMAA